MGPFMLLQTIRMRMRHPNSFPGRLVLFKLQLHLHDDNAEGGNQKTSHSGGAEAGGNTP